MLPQLRTNDQVISSDDEWEDVEEKEEDVDDQEFVEVMSKNLKNRKRKLPPQNKKAIEKKRNCEECDDSFPTESELKKHMKSEHRKPVPIKCVICAFKTQSTTQFLLHMESHEGNKQIRDVCRYFLQGRCKFGNHCRNQHVSRPQCKFRSRCTAWPECNFAHYEVCNIYKECNNQRCPLEHPNKPFLAKNRGTQPPDLSSQSIFPPLPKIKQNFLKL